MASTTFSGPVSSDNGFVAPTFTLATLPTDDKNPEDVDTNAEDHLYDALRYGVMTRPRSNLFDFDASSQRTGFQASDATFGY